MAILKRSELEGLSEKELESRLLQLRIEIMKDNSQVSSGTTPKNPGQLRNNKKNIARLLMLMHEKKKVQKDTPMKTVEEINKDE